jgi:hypothetical protein
MRWQTRSIGRRAGEGDVDLAAGEFAHPTDLEVGHTCAPVREIRVTIIHGI